MAYIPKGCDQQSRLATGVWTKEDIGRRAWRAPHRTHDDGHFTKITMPPPDTQPAVHKTEAHGCWEPEDVPKLKRRYARSLVSAVGVLGALAVVAWFAVGAWR
jgi:hypothetical protein